MSLAQPDQRVQRRRPAPGEPGGPAVDLRNVPLPGQRPTTPPEAIRPDPEAALRWLDLLYGDDPDPAAGYLNVWTDAGRRSSWFPLSDREGAAQEAGALAAAGKNAYYGVGLRSRPFVDGLAEDRRPYARGDAETVSAIPALYADLDIAGPAHKEGALPPTLQDAIGLVDATVPPTLRPSAYLLTGHGLHVYWFLADQPWLLDTQEERDRAGALLRRLQRTLRDAAARRGWRLDNTADLARVLRLPGTLNAKPGLSPAAVRVLEARGNGLRYNPSDFEDWEGLAPDPGNAGGAASVSAPPGGFPPAAWRPVRDGCAFMRHVDDDAASLSEPDWYAGLSIAGRCADGETSGEELAHALSQLYPGYSQRETARKLAHALERGPRTCASIANELGFRGCEACPHSGQIKSPINLGTPLRAAASAVLKAPEAPTPATPGQNGTAGAGHAPPGAEDEREGGGGGPDGYANSDLGNAERLLAEHGDRLRYCPPWKKWLVWDGRRWAEDAGDCRARGLARKVVRRMARTAAELAKTDPKGADALWAWALKCETAGRGPAMLEWARSFDRAWVTPDDLDADDYLLNCANGTLDLRTGALRPHDPADLLTQLAPVEYDPDAQAPRWERAVGEILGEDELVAFVRRLVGQSLTGDVRDHILPVAWGATGRNGKGLLLNTLVAALGDYATPLPADELMVSRGERHPTGQALLYRKRLVVASETEGGRRLAVAKVKELTGGDPIPARRMREDYWSFRPTHTIWLVTNDRPEIAETKNAIWDRVKCIPFETYFRDPAKGDKDDAPRGAPKRVLDKDPDLYRKVAQELPGVLAWAVRGCLEWQRDGLGEPDAVVAATEGYRDDMDVLAQWIEDRCERGAQWSEEATRLYLDYRAWCERTGEKAESQRRFGDRLGERGHGSDRHPVNRRIVRLGLRLAPLPDEDAPPPGGRDGG